MLNCVFISSEKSTSILNTLTYHIQRKMFITLKRDISLSFFSIFAFNFFGRLFAFVECLLSCWFSSLVSSSNTYAKNYYLFYFADRTSSCWVYNVYVHKTRDFGWTEAESFLISKTAFTKPNNRNKSIKTKISQNNIFFVNFTIRFSLIRFIAVVGLDKCDFWNKKRLAVQLNLLTTILNYFISAYKKYNGWEYVYRSIIILISLKTHTNINVYRSLQWFIGNKMF